MLGKRKLLSQTLLDVASAFGASSAPRSKRRRLRLLKGKRRAAAAKPLISKISKDPFPKEWRTKLTWNGDTQYTNPGTTSGASVVALNSLYDPDYSNHFGNFSPMFFSKCLSATGPYQNYKVNSWKGKLTLINVSPVDGSIPTALECYFKQGATNAVDVDTWAEIQSQAGVQTFLVGPKDSDSATRTIYFNGKLSDFIPKDAEGEDYCGLYNSSPAKPIFAGIGYRNAHPGATGVVNCYIKMSIEFDVTLFATDGTQG